MSPVLPRDAHVAPFSGQPTSPLASLCKSDGAPLRLCQTYVLRRMHFSATVRASIGSVTCVPHASFHLGHLTARFDMTKPQPPRPRICCMVY